jgi:ABC-type amino acid transport system permease subunit
VGTAGTRSRLSGGLRGLSRRIRETLYKSRVTFLLLVVSLALAAGIFFAMGAAHFYDVAFIIKTLPQGLGPAETAIEITTFTFVLGMAGAIGLGLVRAYPPKKAHGRSRVWRWPLYGFASGYVAAIRGTPFLVQMFIVYYAIIFSFPTLTLFGWNVEVVAGFLALLINTTGYQTEAFRGGFQSVDVGQTEAGKAVGLSRVQVFARITLPQGLRLVTLPLANEWISNFKTVTILSEIGVIEVFYWARTDIAGLLGRNLEALVMLVIIYLMVNVTVSRVITYVEKVRRIPGLGTPTPEVALPKRLLGVRDRSR